MNNPECYYKLNFPVKNWIKEDIDLSWYPSEFPPYDWGEKRIWALQYPPIDKLLSIEAIEFLKDIGYESNVSGPNTANLFRGDPGAHMGIHHDLGAKFSINLCWGSNDSEMIWYRKLVDNPKTYSKPSTTGRPTDYYYPEDLEEVGRSEITVPTLVRTEIPHHVLNHDPINHRWCVTLRNLTYGWSWQQGVDFFKPWISTE